MAYINMSCGQTMLAPKAIEKMSKQIYEPIYYPTYWESEEKTIDMLKQVMKTRNDVLLIAGSGTYGIEAGFRSVFEPGEKVMVINTGVFGEVGKCLLEIVGAIPVEIKVDYGDEVNLDRVIEVLEKDRTIKGLFVVQDETTTGTIQPVPELGKIAAEFDLIFAVDAISAVGGIEVETDKWGIDLCFASPQKCLNAPQGLAIVAVSPKAWDKIAQRKEKTNSLSLDLEVWKRYHDIKVRAYHKWWQTGGKEPKPQGRAPHEVSPAATLVWGLQGALESVLDEGLEKVISRHQVAGKAVREAVSKLGLEIVAKSEKVASDVVTVVRLPKGIEERDFREVMLRKYGVALGNGEIGSDNVRIGTMGMAASPKYVLPTISALENTLEYFGFKVKKGEALVAAHEVFAGASG
ncbi:aminotransferase class V-fold PLP-dependent enzyme [Moorellaceae bacterium AZ2]